MAKTNNYDELLKISDGPLFNRVMQNHQICKEVLERILKLKIKDLNYISPEHTLNEALGEKWVRLDIYAKTETENYDIEMQVTDKSNLGLRMRYYQVKMDIQFLDVGQEYDDLPNSFVIFICTYDAYGKGLPCYTFNMTCEEDPSVQLGSKIKWLVLNTLAWKDADDTNLSSLLKYIQTGKKELNNKDTLIDKIDAEVKRANDDREWRRRAVGFMTLEHDMRVREKYAKTKGIEEGRAEGREKGLQEGQEKMAQLVDLLMKAGRTEDLHKALKMPEYRDTLYKEYRL